MDIHSKEVRSYNMSRIRGHGTKPEELVCKYLFSKGFRYRKNYKKLPGHPDIVLPKFKTAIFINGCFWHAHEGCPEFVFPKSNIEFWENKFEQNRKRDQLQYATLENSGWKVIIVWACQLKTAKKEETLKNLVEEILRK